jgi:hypothetical protein
MRSIGGVLSVVLLVLAAVSPCRSNPLVDPGDGVLRQDVQLLHGYGLIRGPVDAWPLSWAQVGDSLDARAADDRLPPHIRAAARRLLGERPPADAWRLEARGGFTTQRSLIYGFDGGARRDVDVAASVQRTWRGTTGRLALNYRSRDGDDQLVLDGSRLSVGVGNWILYGGAPERWYGPGEDAGLVLSRNARPIPGVGIIRNVPVRSHHGLIRWMGPWRFEAAVGMLGGDRGDFAHPLNVNLYLSFEPWSRFDVAVARGIMICGEGRPCGLGDWLRSLVGVFDLDNQSGNAKDSDTFTDPSNQNVSLSVAHTFLPGALQLSPYVEWFYEDEIDKLSVLFGTRLLGPARGGAWRGRIEYSDTYANRILGFLDSPWFVPTAGNTYGHYIYTDGYTFHGETIGHSLGGDGRLVTVEAALVGASGWSLLSRFRYADVRPVRGGDPFFRDTFVVELGAQVPVRKNRVGVALRWMEDDPFAPEGEGGVWQVEAAYRLRIDAGGDDTR